MTDLKTYPISDLRIRVEVQDRLWHAHGLDAAEISVAVDDHDVRLAGVVGSTEDARRAEAVARAVEGVRHVRCQLAVRARAAAPA